MVNMPSAERVVVLDTETTGLSTSDRIVEIAAIEVEPRTGRLGPAVHRRVNPCKAIPRAATRIHGIRDADVRDEPPFAALAGELSGFLRGSILAIQNARFDRRVLDAELARSGQPSLADLNVRIVDTVEVSRSLFPLRAKHSLDAICDRIAVDRGDRAEHHGALVDARLLAATLPKFAREYDAWCALAEADCASAVDGFERDFRATVSNAVDWTYATTPERADRALSRIAAAQSWLRSWEDCFAARAQTLVGDDGWCCKHYAARWTSSKNISWKNAANAYLSPTDLDAFRTESASAVLTPRPDGAVTKALSALDAALSAPAIADSMACVARAVVLIRAREATLDGARAALRAALLQYVEAGYTLRHATLRHLTHAPVAYRAAVDALVRGADVAPFTTIRRSLHIAARNTSACAALFG
jgi:DNA polymerase III epsilon subunit